MYSKLFASILDSSVWLEPMPTRIVWLTLLAAKDQDGFARFASIENLARRAIVTEADAQRAVDSLEAPDPRSSNPEHEGRRIERVPGGWVVLNAKLYDDLVRRDDERRATRERVRRHRAKAPEPPTSPIPPIGESLAAHFAQPDERIAYEGARRAARMPVSFDAMLNGIASGISTGKPIAWDIIGRAIVEIQATDGKVSANALRAFCRKLTEAPAAARSSYGGPSSKQERGRAALAETLKRHGYGNGNAPDSGTHAGDAPRALPNPGDQRLDGGSVDARVA